MLRHSPPYRSDFSCGNIYGISRFLSRNSCSLASASFIKPCRRYLLRGQQLD